MDRTTRANTSTPPTHANPSPQGWRYPTGTSDRPDMPTSDVSRSRREVDGHNATRAANSQAHLYLRPSNVSHLQPTVSAASRSIGYIPAPESLSQAQCFQIPLPAGTDPTFKIDIISYGRIGFNLHATASNKDHIRVAPGVERMVNNATMPLEDILESNALFVQRAYYAEEANKPVPKLKSLDPQRQYVFTLGHLITMLQIMQSGHWYHAMKNYPTRLTLQYMTGTDAVVPQELQRTGIKWTNLFATAIRRRKLPEVDKWCYYFQLEVRM
ncbi:hypothetical protein C8Q70DRAFT_1058727 [Cubamyces menziesii]|uniref:Uncharacterized protein n=1 Tax=Trametes cubensis TaxID=1111947 RepID=A0AAD7U055_9APHY|nr:hypothetical protein C8Q70DRAFT_1058727 [Cubamyces menziesii]KAJ8494707.1 hypothetical protein ONZ51_g2181 [Trametes cubensis]